MSGNYHVIKGSIKLSKILLFIIIITIIASMVFANLQNQSVAALAAGQHRPTGQRSTTKVKRLGLLYRQC